MKLKKVGMGILTGVFLLTLSGCGKDARTEFTESFYSTENSQKFNAAKFEMGIDKFEMSADNQSNPYAAMIANQLDDITFDGSYAFNEKDQTMEMEMNLNALGETLPIQFVMEKENIYLSTSFISGALDIVKAFQYPIDISQADLKKLEGKYINISEASSEMLDEKIEDSKEKATTETFTNEKFQKEMRDLIGSFDKDSFTKKDDVVSHVFTKKEINQILDLVQAQAKEEKNTDLVSQIKDWKKSFKEDMDDVTIKVGINTKNSESVTTLDMTSKDEKSEASIKMTVKVTPQKNEEKIKVPTKKEVLSQEELELILSSIYGSSIEDTTDYDDLYNDLYDDSDLSDDSFDQIIESIELYPEEITQEDADALRENGPLIFSEEQMKRLNEALDKALL